MRAVFGLVVGCLALALGGWFFVGTVRDSADLADGVRATGVLQEEPTGCGGGCAVAFEAEGRTVVGELPASQLVKRYHAGSSVPLLYRADDPRRIALQDGVGPGALVLATLMPLLGLVLVVTSAGSWVGRRRRSTRPGPGGAPGVRS